MTLRDWWRKTTADDKRRVAKLIGTSVPMLYQYASGHRVVSVSRASDIEAATHQITPKLRVMRTDLLPTCAACPLRCV